MSETKTAEENPLQYWKENCKENYINTPISVLRYIAVLEQQNQELQSKTFTLEKHNLDLQLRNQQLQRQLEIAQLEAKDNLDNANVIRYEYTQLKDAADEMYNCFASGNLEKIEKALITYKHLTNKP